MPDSVKIGDRRISGGVALLIAIVVLGGLEVVIGYGNAYQSCERTRATRLNRNLGIMHASEFWREKVAGARDRSAANQSALAAMLDDRPGPLAKLLAGRARAQANSDTIAAADYRDYAAQLLEDRAAVPDCTDFPPPT